MTHIALTKGILRDNSLPLTSTAKANCKIRAGNDVEAMERWLDEYFDKPATFRTYKKEAERFLVWCAYARATNLMSLNRDDVEAYIQFLRNPTPKDMWCGPRKKRDTKRWYPFAGPLQESAINTALASLNSMMSYLVDARYLDFNPFSLVRKKNRFHQRLSEHVFSVHERILEEAEWRALLQTIEEEPEHEDIARFKKNRLRFLIAVLFLLGLRVDEVSKARFSDFRKMQGKWWFFVRGKGDRLGKIPVNSSLLQAIFSYRHANTWVPLPDNDDSFLIVSINKNKALTVRQISNLIKDLAYKTAQKFEEHSPSWVKLRKFSPHWLRHLSASRQDLAGISFTNIKSNLRHQSEQTTRIYVHAYDDERHKDMEKLTMNI
jgi:site-specific recombinase XerD